MDQRLDKYLDRAYDDLERRNWTLFGAANKTLRHLRRFRVDVAKLTDEVTHITKFFGDWHLARVYLGARDRFYLWLNTYHWVPSVILALILLAWGGIPMVLWGICLRVTFGLHCTWLVNSLTHVIGTQRFESGDDSRNSFILASFHGSFVRHGHHFGVVTPPGHTWPMLERPRRMCSKRRCGRTTFGWAPMAVRGSRIAGTGSSPTS